MNMKKIVWITPDWFADCDIDIISSLVDSFEIHWVLLFPQRPRFKESDFEMLRNRRNLLISFINSSKKFRNPLKTFDYLKISRIVRKEKPNLIYLNMGIDTPFMIPFLYTLPPEKTIVTAHQGRVHEGMGHSEYIKWLRNIYYERFKNVNMFSKSQAELFHNEHPNSKIFQFLLGLKYYGEPTNKRPDLGDVRFLSFGTINYAKNIDLLIDAACLLYDRGIRGFKVSINGECKDWSWYQKKIKYPEVFDNQIRLINNNEIPNLFNGSHYLVQPYRVVSQSGPTKIAFRYNVPVLTSNLPGFTDEVVEGVNGYSFETGNIVDLADKMQMLIESHKNNYSLLLQKEKAYTEEHYSLKVLAKQYIDMFNNVAEI